jgi:polyhydroxyalkanoate synthesis regulator phasin
MAVVVALSLSFAAPAAADTIYLKNGREIRTAQVRVEGDRVFFIQYGGEVAMPMSLVERIVADANVGPEATPPPVLPVEDPAADPDAAADAESDIPPEETREFWQDRVRTIETEKAEVLTQIEDLRRTERAFLFSRKSTAPTRQSIDAAEARLAELDQEMTDLQAEARRTGVPAGWLRLPAGGGGGTSGGPGGSGG